MQNTSHWWTPRIVLTTGLFFTACLARHVFNRRRAEAALRARELQQRTLAEQYRRLMDSLDNFIIASDYEGRFLYMNEVAAAQMGGTSTALIGKTMHELFSEQMAIKQLHGIRQVMRDDKGAVFEYLNVVHGQSRWQRTSIQPIHDEAGHVSYVLINSTDIHDLKTMQQALQELNRTLEERVKLRTTDLIRVNAELEHAVRAKDAFLANMSHELRTPLNVILSLSEILLEQHRGPLNERQQLALHSIESSGRHLLALINDILDLSKIEAGKAELHYEPILITNVCHASLALVKELAVKKGLHMQVAFQLNDELARLQADPKRLKQMLVNLLSNAIKFTPAGGTVSLEVTTDMSAAVIRFAVQDTGIGIAPAEQARLFQPFTQLDSGLSRVHEGTGLGLALVRHLAELHGGSVRVESEIGQGSCFTITLPYNGSAPMPLESAPEPLEAVPQTLITVDQTAVAIHILLVEDNDFNIEPTSSYLQEHGYTVIVARNGYEAIEQAIATQPHVILMDIQMPHMDGLEAIRRLRAIPAFATTPIIALTALAMPGDHERGLAAGATEYLTKPVSLKVLELTIRRLLERRE